MARSHRSKDHHSRCKKLPGVPRTGSNRRPHNRRSCGGSSSGGISVSEGGDRGSDNREDQTSCRSTHGNSTHQPRGSKRQRDSEGRGQGASKRSPRNRSCSSVKEGASNNHHKSLNHGTYYWPGQNTNCSQKYSIPVGCTKLPPVSQSNYSGILDSDLLSSLNEPSNLRRKPVNLEKLRRYYGAVPTHWPIKQTTSCSFLLYLYHKYIFHIGQIEAASELLRLFHIIRERSEKYFHQNNSSTPILNRRDRCEYWRHQLKNVSGSAFPRVFSRGPAYMLFTHLHALTGKCPFTKDQIIKDITAWVSNADHTERVKDIDHETVKTTLDDVFSRWYHGESGGSLCFKDYCYDFIRWGTSGGAPKTDIAGETYRTKWAWAYANSVLPSGWKHKP